MNNTNEINQKTNLENNLTTIETAINNNQIKTREELLNTLEILKNNTPSYKELIEQKQVELLGLFDSKNPTKTENLSTNNAIDYRILLDEITSKIEKGEFTSKEELTDYLNEIKAKGIPEDVLNSDKIREYLELYDKHHQDSLDLQNYKDIKLENEELIASKKNNDVLVNQSNLSMEDEFKNVQNELTSKSEEGLVNADNAFEEMKKNQKQEVKFIPLSEFSTELVKDSEVLKKIKFFLSNSHINPHEFGINLQNGYFYNFETQDIYEVRINEQTGEYEIYRGGEKVSNGKHLEQPEDNHELIEDHQSEEMSYEKSNIKVKKLVKPPARIDNAAYAKSVFFIVMGVLVATISLSFLFLRILGH